MNCTDLQSTVRGSDSGWKNHNLPKVDTNVTEKHTVSIFRAYEGDSIFLRNVGNDPTRRQNPVEHRHLHSLENLKSHLITQFIFHFLLWN
jgi:hypothetical protein